jgi:hypothetical protein
MVPSQAILALPAMLQAINSDNSADHRHLLSYEAASVGGLFHFKPSGQCRLLAYRVISLRRTIWSLLEA